jgi:hypothetical protein
MAGRRQIVETPVGAGTKNGYKLACPKCGVVNETPDGGTCGVATVDGTEWYRFNCPCGCRYKAKCFPMGIGIQRLG